ncbi:MAG TPA: polyhydroxyalkanoate synthesis regulator DNA-binding domain-containing protein [Steroidobacteraceae bacterium]
MAHFPHLTLELSDRTRVLQAALQLPTFTIEQIAELTGVKEATVQVTVARSKDLIEEVAPVGGMRPVRYRLRESARARVAREAVELAERLRGQQKLSFQDTARGATIALNAVDSSLELASEGGPGAKLWERRAREQLDLARRLLVLVKDPVHRTPLQRRLVQLAGRLEGPDLQPQDEREQFGPMPGATIQPRTQAGSAPAPVVSKAPRTIWKYPNRRLYDALERRYITLNEIHQLVLKEVEFVVIEKKGREDITRAILLQIVAEREQGGAQGSVPANPLLSRDFLSEMIRSCDGAPRGVVGSYLQRSLDIFSAAHKSETGAREDGSEAQDDGA